MSDGRHDIWADFNDIDIADCVVTAADLAEPGVDISEGATVTAGDGAGSTCPATVVGRDGWRVVLRLDLARFQAATGRRADV